MDYLLVKLIRVGKDFDSLFNIIICEEIDIELLLKCLFEVYKIYENLSFDFLNFFIRYNIDDSVCE